MLNTKESQTFLFNGSELWTIGLPVNGFDIVGVILVKFILLLLVPLLLSSLRVDVLDDSLDDFFIGFCWLAIVDERFSFPLLPLSASNRARLKAKARLRRICGPCSGRLWPEWELCELGSVLVSDKILLFSDLLRSRSKSEPDRFQGTFCHCVLVWGDLDPSERLSVERLLVISSRIKRKKKDLGLIKKDTVKLYSYLTY